MIVKQELVKRIKDYFDLNIYETKVWLALLSKGIVSAGETAELSGVPRSRTYDVLEGLAKRGFAIVKIGKPVKYIAVDPKIVIEKMKSNTLNDAHDKVKRLATLHETPEYSELQQMHNSGITPIKPEDLSGHIKGRSNVLVRLRELLESAHKEVAICTTTADFEDKSRVLVPLLDKMSRSSIKIKVALSGDVEAIKKLSAKHQLKIKQTDNPGRFYIADKKETLFMINNESDDNETGVWLSSPMFSGTLSNMFDDHLRK